MAPKQDKNLRNCFCPLSLGLALGLVWGLAVFIAGLLAAYAGMGTAFVAMLGEFYIGYNASFFCSLVGAAWGFVDGFVGGVLFAWIYNWFCYRCFRPPE